MKNFSKGKRLAQLGGMTEHVRFNEELEKLRERFPRRVEAFERFYGIGGREMQSSSEIAKPMKMTSSWVRQMKESVRIRLANELR